MRDETITDVNDLNLSSRLQPPRSVGGMPDKNSDFTRTMNTLSRLFQEYGHIYEGFTDYLWYNETRFDLDLSLTGIFERGFLTLEKFERGFLTLEKFERGFLTLEKFDLEKFDLVKFELEFFHLGFF